MHTLREGPSQTVRQNKQ